MCACIYFLICAISVNWIHNHYNTRGDHFFIVLLSQLKDLLRSKCPRSEGLNIKIISNPLYPYCRWKVTVFTTPWTHRGPWTSGRSIMSRTAWSLPFRTWSPRRPTLSKCWPSHPWGTDPSLTPSTSRSCPEVSELVGMVVWERNVTAGVCKCIHLACGCKDSGRVALFIYSCTAEWWLCFPQHS